MEERSAVHLFSMHFRSEQIDRRSLSRPGLVNRQAGEVRRLLRPRRREVRPVRVVIVAGGDGGVESQGRRVHRRGREGGCDRPLCCVGGRARVGRRQLGRSVVIKLPGGSEIRES